MKQLFSHDAATGISEFFHYDPVTDVASIERQQQVAPIIDVNKAEFNEHTSLDRWGDGKKVASIPLTLYYDLKKKGITNDQTAFKRWLNDPDNRVFRTRPGKV